VVYLQRGYIHPGIAMPVDDWCINWRVSGSKILVQNWFISLAAMAVCYCNYIDSCSNGFIMGPQEKSKHPAIVKGGSFKDADMQTIIG